MDITNISINRIHNQGKLIAVASVTVDSMIVISGVRVLQSSEKELKISMPKIALANGIKYDIVRLISKEARSIFENLLIPAVEKMLREGRNSADYSMKKMRREAVGPAQTLDEFDQAWEDSTLLVSASIKEEIAEWLGD